MPVARTHTHTSRRLDERPREDWMSGPEREEFLLESHSNLALAIRLPLRCKAGLGAVVALRVTLWGPRTASCFHLAWPLSAILRGEEALEEENA